MKWAETNMLITCSYCMADLRIGNREACRLFGNPVPFSVVQTSQPVVLWRFHSPRSLWCMPTFLGKSIHSAEKVRSSWELLHSSMWNVWTQMNLDRVLHNQQPGSDYHWNKIDTVLAWRCWCLSNTCNNSALDQQADFASWMLFEQGEVANVMLM